MEEVIRAIEEQILLKKEKFLEQKQTFDEEILSMIKSKQRQLSEAHLIYLEQIQSLTQALQTLCQTQNLPYPSELMNKSVVDPTLTNPFLTKTEKEQIHKPSSPTKTQKPSSPIYQGKTEDNYVYDTLGEPSGKYDYFVKYPKITPIQEKRFMRWADEVEAQLPKKFYVIFNGPSKGIFDEWAKASIHISGKKGTIHKSYRSMDEAKEALKTYEETQGLNSYKNILQEIAPNKSSKYTNLGSIPTAGYHPFDEVKTKAETTKDLELTVENFHELAKTLIQYDEEKGRKDCYYPVFLNGPKAVFIEESCPKLVALYFKFGFIDAIYTQTDKPLIHLPYRIKDAIKSFLRAVSNRGPKTIVIKFFVTYPIFGQKTLPSTGVVKIAIMSGTLPDKAFTQGFTSQLEFEEASARQMLQIVFKIDKLFETSKFRLNYCSETHLVYSLHNKEIPKEQINHIDKFINKFIYYPEEKERLPEHMMAIIHHGLRKWQGHYCQLCENDPESDCHIVDDNVSNDESPPIIEDGVSSDVAFAEPTM